MAKTQIGVSNFHLLHFKGLLRMCRDPEMQQNQTGVMRMHESIIIFCICNPQLTKIIKKTQRKHCYRNTNMKSAMTKFKATTLNRERQIHLEAVRSSKVFHI